jgi:hypothetical protein
MRIKDILITYCNNVVISVERSLRNRNYICHYRGKIMPILSIVNKIYNRQFITK